MRFSHIALILIALLSGLCSVWNFLLFSLFTKLNRSEMSGGAFKNLEESLRKHLPDAELKEAKRILYGRSDE